MKAAMYAIIKKDFRIVASNRRLFPALFIVPLVLTIARALIAKPDVIFADEPTGNLDSKSGGEVMELLQNVWKKMGKALVVITHDSRIARMADRQFQIVDGVLAEVTAK